MNFDKRISAWSPHYDEDVDHFHSLTKFCHGTYHRILHHTWPEATTDLPSDTKDLIYRFWNFFEMESYNICSAYLFLSPILPPSLFLFLLARAALHGHRKACESPLLLVYFGLIPVIASNKGDMHIHVPILFSWVNTEQYHCRVYSKHMFMFLKNSKTVF